jgi:DNA polymerase V
MATSGFPSPAADYDDGRIDLNRELIPSPLSTFVMRVRGNAMRQDGLWAGDLLVIDRSLTARAGCVVVAVHEGRFLVRRLRRNPRPPHTLQLVANDGVTPPVPLDSEHGEGAQLWGVVTYAVHHLLRHDHLTRRAAGRRGP